MDTSISAPIKPTIDATAFKSYLDSGCQVIPLHRYNDTATDKKGSTKNVGKAPIHFNWTVRKYVPADVVEQCIRERRNMGLRMTAEQLAIDVDVRNGGGVGFHNLCDDLKLDPSSWPNVKTGGGGDHYFLTLPPGVRILGSLALESDDPEQPKQARYRGVEFKSKGAQVLCAGSVHPNGTLYEWDAFSPLLTEAPQCPAN